MKCIRKLWLSGLLAFSLFSNTAMAKEYHFQDAGQIPWAASSVEKLYEEGIMSGINGTQFSPHTSMTRAQFATVLAKVADKPIKTKKFPFKDVPSNQWYYPSVKKMYGMGMIKGISEKEFAPNRQVTREEAAVILARTFDYSYKGGYSLPFTDKNNISDWSINSVKALTQKGVFALFQNQFQPKKAITRAEIAVILHHILYGVPAPYDPPKKMTSRSNELIDQRLNKVINSVLGVPYVYGGSTTKGFDCSGFTGYVYKQLGVDLPRDSRSQFTVGEKVSMSEMAKGDLIFFDTGGGSISHVGIYIGNNKMAHAASSQGEVQIDNLDWYVNNYKVVGVKRPM